jgi:hypothetical protein
VGASKLLEGVKHLLKFATLKNNIRNKETQYLQYLKSRFAASKQHVKFS